MSKLMKQHLQRDRERAMSTCSTPAKGLWQYAVWYRDPKDHANDKLVTEVTNVVANDAKHVERIALRGLSQEWDAKIENIEVVVRPF